MKKIGFVKCALSALFCLSSTIGFAELSDEKINDKSNLRGNSGFYIRGDVGIGIPSKIKYSSKKDNPFIESLPVKKKKSAIFTPSIALGAPIGDTGSVEFEWAHYSIEEFQDLLPNIADVTKEYISATMGPLSSFVPNDLFNNIFSSAKLSSRSGIHFFSGNYIAYPSALQEKIGSLKIGIGLGVGLGLGSYEIKREVNINQNQISILENKIIGSGIPQEYVDSLKSFAESSVKETNDNSEKGGLVAWGPSFTLVGEVPIVDSFNLYGAVNYKYFFGSMTDAEKVNSNNKKEVANSSKSFTSSVFSAKLGIKLFL